MQIFNHIYDFAKAALGNEPGLGSRELALDVGCGHGVVALELAKKYSKVSVGAAPWSYNIQNPAWGRKVLPLVAALKRGAVRWVGTVATGAVAVVRERDHCAPFQQLNKCR